MLKAANQNKIRNVATIGLMIAIIEVLKLTLAALPNIELTTFLIIMFTLYFGKKTFFAIPAFIIIEILIFGFNIFWVLAYFYIWPLLFIVTYLLRKNKNVISMSCLSGLFGLFFGFLSSFPYIFISAGHTASIKYALSWWIAGIPFDLIHGVSNFIIMLVLFKPVSRVFESSYFLERK